MTPGELDDFTLRRIFVEDVRRRVFLTGSPSATPRAVLVGAQPGAGKTQVVAAAATGIPGGVRIVGDDLRRFHPEFVELMATDPLAMPGRTAQASGRWVEMCLQEAAQERVSCVVESTFRSARVGLATAGMLREAGFTVEVRAVAVPPAVSRLGTVQRYAAQLQDKGAGRWTPSAAHEQAVAGMAGTVSQLVAAGVVDRVQVVARDTRVMLTADVPAGEQGRAQVVDDVAQALAGGQSVAVLEHAAAVDWVGGYARCARVLAEHAERGLDVLATMARLAAEAPAVVDQLLAADRAAARDQIAAAGLEVGAMRAQAMRAASFPAPPVQRTAGVEMPPQRPESGGWWRRGRDEQRGGPER